MPTVNLFFTKRFINDPSSNINHILGVHEYLARRVLTVSKFFFELKSSTRYFEVLGPTQTTRTKSSYSNENELLELSRASWLS